MEVAVHLCWGDSGGVVCATYFEPGDWVLAHGCTGREHVDGNICGRGPSIGGLQRSCCSSGAVRGLGVDRSSHCQGDFARGALAWDAATFVCVLCTFEYVCLCVCVCVCVVCVCARARACSCMHACMHVCVCVCVCVRVRVCVGLYL